MRSYVFMFYCNHLLKYFLNAKETIDVPTNVAVQYNQMLVHIPDNRTGARDRAGFMEAPDIEARKKISNPTIPPIAIGPNPLNPFVKTTSNIIPISNAEAKTSMPNIEYNGKV